MSNYRVLFGANNLYVFHLPNKAMDNISRKNNPTFDSAQDEMALKSGLVSQGDELSLNDTGTASI